MVAGTIKPAIATARDPAKIRKSSLCGLTATDNPTITASGLPTYTGNVQVQAIDALAGPGETCYAFSPFLSRPESFVLSLSTCLRTDINIFPRPLETPPPLSRPTCLARCSRCCKPSLPRPCRQASRRETHRRRIRRPGMHYLQATGDEMVSG